MKKFVDKLTTAYIYVRSTLALYRTGRYTLNLIPDSKTITALKDHHYSLARFGDGEFRWMHTTDDICSFQKPSMELSHALSKALNSPKSNLLIGLPLPLFNDAHCTFEAKSFWRQYSVNNRAWLESILPHRRYCNASITRPYLDYQDKSTAEDRFSQIKSIWQDKNVLLVEGEKTKFGVNNDLLDNARHIRRIICPAENAFSRYNTIKETLLSTYQEGEIVLACLGPTATILAADETLDSIQIIDIGHLDIEYEWFLMKATSKVAIKGKYVNEANSQGDASLDNDNSYQNSIIAMVSEE